MLKRRRPLRDAHMVFDEKSEPEFVDVTMDVERLNIEPELCRPQDVVNRGLLRKVMLMDELKDG